MASPPAAKVRDLWPTLNLLRLLLQKRRSKRNIGTGNREFKVQKN